KGRFFHIWSGLFNPAGRPCGPAAHPLYWRPWKRRSGFVKAPRAWACSAWAMSAFRSPSSSRVPACAWSAWRPAPPAWPRRAAAPYARVVRQVVPVSSAKAAELVKLLENSFRAVNIALVNEMAQICHKLGLDVWEVVGAAATKPFGFMPFWPGPGIGGHCIPLDTYYLAWKAREYDFATRFIELAGEVNNNMPYFCRSVVS